MLSVLTQILTQIHTYIVVDGCFSNLVNVGSGVPWGSVLGLLLFMNTSERSSVLANKLYAHPNSTLVDVVIQQPL